MVSLPVEPKNTLASKIFPDAKVIYSFKKGVGYIRLKPNEKIKPGAGYWVLLPETRSHKFLGDCIQEYTLPVGNGWHLIGSCSNQARPYLNIGNIDLIYRYDLGYGYRRVLETEKLEPALGYWILMNNIPDQAELKVRQE